MLLYEIKFLVPNYSCLQNTWLEGYRPQIPVLSVLCPQLNLLKPSPRTKSLGTPLVIKIWGSLRWFSPNPQSAHSVMICDELHRNWIKNVENGANAPLSEVWVSLHRFSQNSHLYNPATSRYSVPNFIKIGHSV